MIKITPDGVIFIFYYKDYKDYEDYQYYKAPQL